MNRSALMARIRGKDTAPELRVRSILHAQGYRFRLHAPELPGRPDIVFRPRRAAIFVHGCFWHSHDCPRGARRPKTNQAYWEAKLAANRRRDAASLAALEAAGWRCLTLWECELTDAESLADRLRLFLESAAPAASLTVRRGPRSASPIKTSELIQADT